VLVGGGESPGPSVTNLLPEVVCLPKYAMRQNLLSPPATDSRRAATLHSCSLP
jgi:hypothetical protein